MKQISLIGFKDPLSSNDYEPLKVAYEKALAAKDKFIHYKNNILLTDLVKYHLEYMETLKMTKHVD